MQDKSQFGEALVIDSFFKRNPPKHKTLVDVGAYGAEMSNTWNLVMEQGWNGILIDGNPVRLEKIESDFHTLSVKVVIAAVGDERGVVRHYRHMVDPHDSLLSDWKPQTQHHSIYVAVVTLTEILDACGVPEDFDFLSVDVEGMDKRVLKRFFEDGKYHPTLIVYEESDSSGDNIFFKNAGYELMETSSNGPNRFYVRK